MDSSTLSRLFRENRHSEILSICEKNIAIDPNDLESIYCAAFASLMTGNIQKCFVFFQMLIDIYNAYAPKLEMKPDVLSFIGYSIIQMVVLAEYQRLKNKAEIFQKGVSLAKTIALQAGNKQLENMSNSLDSRLKRTVGGGVCLIPSSPLVLQVEPTNKCNLKCKMCPRLSMTRPQGYLDLNLFESMISGWNNKEKTLQITHLVFNIPFALKYPGGKIKLYFMGEPLLHPNFDLLIKMAKDAGCPIEIQTNGTMLKRKDIRKRLLISLPTGIAISLDGIDSKTYNTVRKGSTLDRIFSSIKDLTHERKEMGLDGKIVINVSTIVPEATDANHKRALFFLDEIRPYVDNLNAITLDRSYNPQFFNENGNIVLYKKESSAGYPKNMPLCEEPLEKLNILWDGTVTPCCYDINGDFRMGNVRNNTIDEIWRSAEVVSLHNALLSHDIKAYPLCNACKF